MSGIAPISRYDAWKLASPYEDEQDPEPEEDKTMAETTKANIATMTAKELQEHIQALQERLKSRVRTLRALARARKAEEEAKE